MKVVTAKNWPMYLLVLISALLNWFAQPNEMFLNGNWFFGLLSFIPLYIGIIKFNGSRGEIRLWALLYAVTSTLTSYFWLKNFGEYSLWTISGVLLVYIIFYFALFRLLFHLMKNPGLSNSRKSYYRPFVFSLIWICFEFFKSRGYLAFPWNLAAFPFHQLLALNQVAELSGVWSISLLILLVQSVLAEQILHPGKNMRQIFFVLSIFLIFMTYGSVRLNTINTQSTDSKALVLLIQQNVDSWASNNEQAGMETAITLSLKGMSEAIEKYGKKPDIISWSETSLNYFYDESGSYYARFPESLPFRTFLELTQNGILTGAPLLKSRDPFIAMNGIIQLDRKGTVRQDYGKIHLIPFAEHVPLTDLPFFTRFLTDVIGIPGGGWNPGDGIRVFNYPDLDLTIGTPVCFEDSFAKNTRYFVKGGANLLLNLTNNSWSKTASAQMQHLVSARYRAIENRVPLLRATNGGVTSIITADGAIQSSIPMFQSDYLLDEIEFNRRPAITAYTILGDWFPWCMTLLLLLCLIHKWIIKKKDRPGGQSL